MKRQESRNLPASIHQRLLNEARSSGRPFSELLQYFAMERFLYRLSRSRHADRFVLKGALMLAAWKISPTRPTKDIDLLGHLANDVERIAAAVKDICRQDVEPDGLTFDPESVQGERVAEEAEYQGVRVRFQGNLGAARVLSQIDVGFGDAIVPGPVVVDYPGLLDLPAPRIRGYTRESVIAEKFHTMVRRGTFNSRMRDFFDVWVLSQRFDFDAAVLAEAIRKTFSRRDTEVLPRPVSLTNGFAEETTKAAQWRAFLRRNRLQDAPGDLLEVVRTNTAFLQPVAAALHEGRTLEGRWKAPGPWSAR